MKNDLVEKLGDYNQWSPREIWDNFSPELIAEFPEDSRIEYKSYKKIDFGKLAEYYSAFSNSRDGGILCLGVSNDGDLDGCASLPEAHLDSIYNFHITLCPRARPEVKKIPIPKRDDFLLLIYLPHVTGVVETNKLIAWIRSGDSTHKLGEERKRDMKVQSNQNSFELEPTSYIYPDDFDSDIIRSFCDRYKESKSRYNWSDEDALIDAHLAEPDDDSGSIIPLKSMVLLSAINPCRLIPGCRVRVLRYSRADEGSGETYSAIWDHDVRGNIVDVIKRATELIDSALYMDFRLDKDVGKFVDLQEYPRDAWLEVLVNACIHRMYSLSGSDIMVKIFPDRMEVESPGGFFAPVTRENIYDIRSSRNIFTMEALKHLGYVRMAREGVPRIRNSMLRYGFPAPEFRENVGASIIVSLKRGVENVGVTTKTIVHFFGVDCWAEFSGDEQIILKYVYDNGRINISGASNLTGRSWKASRSDLEKLCTDGFLIHVRGKGSHDPKAHYVLGMDKE